jgi:hypothetical protein
VETEEMFPFIKGFLKLHNAIQTHVPQGFEKNFEFFSVKGNVMIFVALCAL